MWGDSWESEDHTPGGSYMTTLPGTPLDLSANSEQNMGDGSWPTYDFWVVFWDLWGP